MGGNLFKLGRLPRARYLELEAELRAADCRDISAGTRTENDDIITG